MQGSYSTWYTGRDKHVPISCIMVCGAASHTSAPLVYVYRFLSFAFCSFLFLTHPLLISSSTMTADSPTMVATLDNIEELLKDDTKVKIAVLDMDGVLRGKMINKTRFLQTLTNGFGTTLDTPRWL